jgi:hypothetical protein
LAKIKEEAVKTKRPVGESRLREFASAAATLR